MRNEDLARDIIEGQFEATSRVVVSQDRITTEVNKVSSSLLNISNNISSISYGILSVLDGIEELEETVDRGFSEVVWRLELQTETLKNIVQELQSPLDVQAKELRKRAEEAYRNNWIEDALEDFLESEKKNRYDFTIHQSLGNIYLFHKNNQEKALEYYKKAAKYAEPYSHYYTSIALLHIGLVKYFQKDFQKAYEATLEAAKLSPNFYEAHYRHAQYCANLNKKDEAIKHLRTAIVGGRYYCIKADSEKDFKAMKKRLVSLFEELRNSAGRLAKNKMDEAAKLIQVAESYEALHYAPHELELAKKKLKEAEDFFRRESYFDYLDTELKAADAKQKATDAQKMAKYNFLVSQVKSLEEQISEVDCKYSIAVRTIGKIKNKLSDEGFFSGCLVMSLLVLGFTPYLSVQLFIGIVFPLFLLLIKIFWDVGRKKVVSWQCSNYVKQLDILENNLSETQNKKEQTEKLVKEIEETLE